MLHGVSTMARDGAPPFGAGGRRARELIGQEARALDALAAELDDAAFGRAVDLLDSASGRVIATGIGKSGHVARKVAATMASVGTPALFLHAGEAAHGDLGMIVEGDAVLGFSKSGTTIELMPVLDRALEIGAPFVLVSANDTDGLAFHADAVIKMPARPELWVAAPTTSTAMQVALGDALAVCLAERRAFGPLAFRKLHPGGAIGGKSIRAGQIPG